jgi:hypothetical protein
MDLARLEAACAELAALREPEKPEPIRLPYFVRVRKRKLKGADGDWRAYARGPVPTSAMSFDLVRAVRVDGKPRHKVLLGLGSQKDVEHRHRSQAVFWYAAFRAMEWHGLDIEQRRRVAEEMIRKGARRPSADHCETYSMVNALPGFPDAPTHPEHKPELLALAGSYHFSVGDGDLVTTITGSYQSAVSGGDLVTTDTAA